MQNINYPEGLYMGLSDNGEIAVFDAGGVMHLKFSGGATYDPPAWLAAMVAGVCDGLEIQHLYNADGDELMVEDFVQEKS